MVIRRIFAIPVPARALTAPLLAAALALVLLAPAVARAAAGGASTGTNGTTPNVEEAVEEKEEKEEKEPPPPPPHLLLFHGGSFLYDDPSFEPETVDRARAAGFVPHYVTYPLGNMPAAVLAARAEARRLRLKFGRDRVYAYGSSAGGTLAALLAGDDLIAAAVAKAPVSDLVGWEWPLGAYGPEYFSAVALGPAARYRLSPLRRPQRTPLLVVQGRADQIVPAAMNEAFAAKFKRVHLWQVAGGHTTERTRPWLIEDAMGWLSRVAQRQWVAAHRPVKVVDR